MTDYSALRLVEAFPDALRSPTGNDAELQSLRDATIVRIGTTNDLRIEGGGLLIDYRRPGETEVRRGVFAFNEIGLWMEWEGVIPTKENDSE